MPEFVKDVEQIRERAVRKIEEGAVTESYKGDVEKTISILNEALATEIVCVLRYMHHYFMATGVHGKSVSAEFKEHADAEREHADRIAERIQQLGGKPDYNPASLLQRSVSQYIEGETLADMIREDLIAERIVIEVYQKMVRHFADDDPTTRVMIEEILADEEEHASDLSDLLYIVDPKSGETKAQDPGTDPLREGGKRDAQRDRRGTAMPRSRQTAVANESQEVLEALERTVGKGGSNVRERQRTEKFAGRGSAGARPESKADKNWKVAKPKKGRAA
jgi:bacterioferritin